MRVLSKSSPKALPQQEASPSVQVSTCWESRAEIIGIRSIRRESCITRHLFTRFTLLYTTAPAFLTWLRSLVCVFFSLAPFWIPPSRAAMPPPAGGRGMGSGGPAAPPLPPPPPLVPPLKKESIFSSEIPSWLIFSLTAASGRPIFCIFEYFARAGSASAAAGAGAGARAGAAAGAGAAAAAAGPDAGTAFVRGGGAAPPLPPPKKESISESLTPLLAHLQAHCRLW